jgi:hypothetical protein
VTVEPIGGEELLSREDPSRGRSGAEVSRLAGPRHALVRPQSGAELGCYLGRVLLSLNNMAPKRHDVYSLECGMLYPHGSSALRTIGVMLNHVPLACC